MVCKYQENSLKFMSPETNNLFRASRLNFMLTCLLALKLNGVPISRDCIIIYNII